LQFGTAGSFLAVTFLYLALIHLMHPRSAHCCPQ
jgi:hypothetical protein